MFEVKENLSVNIKREVLRLLREDEEFRYAVAGMIGLDEILKRFKVYDEKFEEILKRLDRHEEELVRHRKELVRLREETAGLGKKTLRLGEEMVKLREDMLRGFERMDRHLSALGARWGLMAEEAFREGLKGFLEKELKLSVKRWVQHDEEGIVYGYPSIVEIDLSISDEKITLIEISSHVRPSDILLFVRKAQLYDRATGRKPDRLIMVTPYADKEALETAEKHGIEIYTKA